MLRLRVTLSAAAVTAAAAFAGCGGSGGDPAADPAAVTPAGAPVYIEATLKSDEDFDAIAKKLAGTDDPGADLKRAFEKAVNEGGGSFKYDDDVKPWIGDRIAFFFTKITEDEDDMQGALVAPTKDPDKAKEALEKDLDSKEEGDKQPQVTEHTYKDTKYKVDTANDNAVLVTDDYAVFGTEQGVKGVIDAQDGESLADADAFKKARDQVDDDGLGFGYVKMSTVFSGLSGPEAAAAREVFGMAGDTVALSLDAEDDAIDMDVAAIGGKAAGGTGDPGAVLADLPGDAWLAAGTSDIGASLEQSLQQLGQLSALGGTDLETALAQIEKQTGIDVREELSWMGDGGVFVRGAGLTDIGGALVVNTKDAGKTKAFIGKVRKLLRQLSSAGLSVSSLDASGADAGFTVRSSDLPLPIHAALAGDKFIVAVTDGALEAALKPSGKLSDNAAFKSAGDRLGDGIKPAFFVDMAPVRNLVDASGQVPQDADAQKARKALDHLTSIVAGTKRDGDVQHAKLSVGVK